MKINSASLLFLLIVEIASCKKTGNPSIAVIPNPPDTTGVTSIAIDVPAKVFIVGIEYGERFHNTNIN